MTFRILTILLMLVPVWTWSSLAIIYAGPESLIIRLILLAVFIAALPAAFYFSNSFWLAMIPLSIIYTLILVWWNSLSPSNDKNWAPEFANIPSGQIEGDILTLHNVRNFDLQTRTEFSELWETRTYNLDKITSVDLFLSYWGSPHMAHTILSWGFANGDHLAVSIETRKDKTQKFSSIKGFFKQFNLSYIAADERDLIRLRTNVRKEEVYIYRLKGLDKNRMRALLNSYVSHMNQLVEQPQFYHALRMNCTSTIQLHNEAKPDQLPFDWRLVVNGHVDEMLYDYGAIRNDIPFSQVREQSRIDLEMQKFDATDFSARLRKVAKIE